AGMNLAHAIVHGHTAYDLSEADAKRFAPEFNSLEHLMARAPEILGTHYDISYPGKQLSSARNLRALPLDVEYRAASAHMGQFYGWERPLYFGKTKDPTLRFDRPDWFDQVGSEVMAAHDTAAIFDASSFGKIDVTGPDAEAFLLRVCAGHVQRPAGSVIYSAMLNDRGTFESDLTAQRIAEDHYRLFVGTSAIKRDLSWLHRHADGFEVAITDCTKDYAVLALMGPDAARIATECGASALTDLGYFRVGPAQIAGKHVWAARMSYVGESGWEITCRSENAPTVYAALTAAGAMPAGLFAQTSMRIEKGFCAMGHELDGDVTPIEAGLMFAVRKSGGFIGAEALSQRQADGARATVVSLTFANKAIVPLGHEPIYHTGRIVGQTSSCAFGYRIDAPVALAHLHDPVDNGAVVEVDIAGTRAAASVTIGPLFDPAGARMRQ
ncbi:MAG: glycine cleavage T C-terminal barrel domain-containing protein, partial [Pseudomonadota bacterium]